MKKNFFIFVFFTFIFLASKAFAYSSDPKEFISEIVDEAKRVLVETNSKEFKSEKLSEMALKTVDIKGVAYYSLGNYRKSLTEEQMKEYLSLFEKYFLKSLYLQNRSQKILNKKSTIETQDDSDWEEIDTN